MDSALPMAAVSLQGSVANVPRDVLVLLRGETKG